MEQKEQSPAVNGCKEAAGEHARCAHCPFRTKKYATEKECGHCPRYTEGCKEYNEYLQALMIML